VLTCYGSRFLTNTVERLLYTSLVAPCTVASRLRERIAKNQAMHHLLVSIKTEHGKAMDEKILSWMGLVL
jgi:hypothetical protein